MYLTKEGCTTEMTKMNLQTHKGLKLGAKVALIVLLLSILGQFISMFQTEYMLTNPLIPESTIWDINKQLAFTGCIQTAACLIALVLYFFDKYLVVIIWVVIVLIASRFVYLPFD